MSTEQTAAATPSWYESLNEFMGRWIRDFPCLVKSLERLTADDRCASSARMLAAGAAFFLLHGGKAVPRTLRPFLAFANAVVLLIALELIREQLTDAVWEEYEANCPPLRDIASAMTLIRTIIGTGFGATQRFVMGLVDKTYRGYRTDQVVMDPAVRQFVGDDLMAFAAEHTPNPDAEIDTSKLLPPPEEIPSLMEDLG